MKHTWKAAAAGALAVLFVSPNAQAQLAVAKVVATCGTVSPTPHVGTNYPLTIDITGTLCSVGGGGGGGGGTSSNFGAAFPGAGTAAGFEYLTVPPTLTSGQMVAGQTDVNGNLKVTVVAGGGSNASVGTTAAAVPGSATYAGMNVGGNLTGLVGTANGLTVAQATAANFNATVSPVLAATWGLLAQNATTSGQLAQLMMGAVTTAAPTYTTTQSSPLSLDTSGNLRVSTTDGGMSVSHAATTALAAALSTKTSAGSLTGFNCTAITGGAAGYCVVYNSATTPSAGALTGALVLDFCQFDTTARGCALGRAPSKVTYSAGIQVLVTSAASPYTYTTGTDTAAISADFQ